MKIEPNQKFNKTLGENASDKHKNHQWNSQITLACYLLPASISDD